MKPLDCHDLYSNADLYDAQHLEFVADIPFYVGQGRKQGGAILELACGTGRITIPLADEGFDITGLDVSRSMLDRARQKASDADLDITWIEADCRDFELERKFSLIFIPFNSFLHIHELDDLESFFAAVTRHLEPDGRFIIDVYNPSLSFLNRDPEKRYPVTYQPDSSGEDPVSITEDNHYDRKSQVNHIKLYYRVDGVEEEVIQELNHRVFFPQELRTLLKYNGFEIEVCYGDFDLSPFESDSPKQLLVCRPGKAL